MDSIPDGTCISASIAAAMLGRCEQAVLVLGWFTRSKMKAARLRRSKKAIATRKYAVWLVKILDSSA